MRYGFDKFGGFIVVDDELRIGVYCFHTSSNESAARRNAAKTAERIIRCAIEGRMENPLYQRIAEEHYVRCAENLSKYAASPV